MYATSRLHVHVPPLRLTRQRAGAPHQRRTAGKGPQRVDVGVVQHALLGVVEVVLQIEGSPYDLVGGSLVHPAQVVAAGHHTGDVPRRGNLHQLWLGGRGFGVLDGDPRPVQRAEPAIGQQVPALGEERPGVRGVLVVARPVQDREAVAHALAVGDHFLLVLELRLPGQADDADVEGAGERSQGAVQPRHVRDRHDVGHRPAVLEEPAHGVREAQRLIERAEFVHVRGPVRHEFRFAQVFLRDRARDRADQRRRTGARSRDRPGGRDLQEVYTRCLGLEVAHRSLLASSVVRQGCGRTTLWTWWSDRYATRVCRSGRPGSRTSSVYSPKSRLPKEKSPERPATVSRPASTTETRAPVAGRVAPSSTSSTRPRSAGRPRTDGSSRTSRTAGSCCGGSGRRGPGSPSAPAPAGEPPRGPSRTAPCPRCPSAGRRRPGAGAAARAAPHRPGGTARRSPGNGPATAGAAPAAGARPRP